MSIFLDALHGHNQNVPPIWFMRQAGRYLPAYRRIKEGRSLYEMFHNPETIAQVTLLPIDQLGVDAAILFSDILMLLDGLHIRYDFQDGIGPIVLDPPSMISLLHPEEAYGHIRQAILTLKKSLSIPLLGFAGAPFTIASYLIEGKSSKELRKTKRWLYHDPKGFTHLINTLTEATITYIHYQIDAGVDAIQLFDSWANALPLEEFRTFSLDPMRRIVEAVKGRNIPTILFCRGSCFFARELASISPTAISLDWSGDMQEIRRQLPRSIALQGNLDPSALYASREGLRGRADALLQSMKGEQGYIFNLGHGILPDTPVENVQFLVDHVHATSLTQTQ
jgi:uroporphyrinogen decarboxylase